MSAKVRPVFWRRQPDLPLGIRHFIQARVEAALRDPARRTLLAWPAILGSPVLRKAHPGGLSDGELLNQAVKMVTSVGSSDPARTWQEDLLRWPDTAVRREGGWSSHAAWEPFAADVSLRCAVALLALTGQPEDERYLLASGVALFNLGMYHECHDALELLWRQAEGDLKAGLQGLILLACGFYHQQQHHTAGMRSIWKDGVPQLRQFQGEMDTPWGRIGYAESLAMALRRLEWLKQLGAEKDMARFWETPPPEWELA